MLKGAIGLLSLLFVASFSPAYAQQASLPWARTSPPRATSVWATRVPRISFRERRHHVVNQCVGLLGSRLA
jgi:hypothetical protein